MFNRFYEVHTGLFLKKEKNPYITYRHVHPPTLRPAGGNLLHALNGDDVFFLSTGIALSKKTSFVWLPGWGGNPGVIR